MRARTTLGAAAVIAVIAAVAVSSLGPTEEPVSLVAASTTELDPGVAGDDRRERGLLGTVPPGTVESVTATPPETPPAVPSSPPSGPVPARAAPPAPAPDVPAPAAPPAERGCVDGDGERRCGPPAPAPVVNEPATVAVTSGPETGTVGRRLWFQVTITDPDGGGGPGGCEAWTHTDPDAPQIGGCGDKRPRCGPGVPFPPAPGPSTTVHDYVVAFAEPGIHTITVSGVTGPDDIDGCENPYRSEWTHSWTVEILPVG